MSQRDVRQSSGALFADSGQDGLLHRAFLRGSGLSAKEVRNSPVIGIALSASDLNPCNGGTGELVERVKEGVRAAGGLPLAFPTISVSEPFSRPTSMYLRNLMSIDVEEMIGCSPIDGVVLIGGCDKTVPAQLMGAISAGKPTAMVTAGPRAVSRFGNNDEFTMDDVWPVCEARRVGDVSDQEWARLEGCVIPGFGTCNVLGTAISMAAIAEVLGFALPGSALPPADSEQRRSDAYRTGVQIVESVRAGRIPRELVGMRSLENAFRVVSALGGSTNAVIHLEAIAGRAGHVIGLDNFEQWAGTTPYVADVRPGGQYSLASLAAAGGVPAVMASISSLLHLDLPTASGTLWKELLEQTAFAAHPALKVDPPLSPSGGIVVLRGNLAPRGALIKVAGRHHNPIRQHRGKAIVFNGIEDLNARIDDPELDVDESSVLVLRGLGVVGGPGMPEVGHIPIPAKLHRIGVRDMVRISDARMSGTSTGTVVLHVTPEAAAGGPLGLVRDGDEIELDVDRGLLHLHVEEAELADRRPYTLPEDPERGMGWLNRQHVLQPDEGCDFDFLRRPMSVPTKAARL